MRGQTEVSRIRCHESPGRARRPAASGGPADVWNPLGFSARRKCHLPAAAERARAQVQLAAPGAIKRRPAARRAPAPPAKVNQNNNSDPIYGPARGLNGPAAGHRDAHSSGEAPMDSGALAALPLMLAHLGVAISAPGALGAPPARGVGRARRPHEQVIYCIWRRVCTRTHTAGRHKWAGATLPPVCARAPARPATPTRPGRAGAGARRPAAPQGHLSAVWARAHTAATLYRVAARQARTDARVFARAREPVGATMTRGQSSNQLSGVSCLHLASCCACARRPTAWPLLEPIGGHRQL